MFIGSEFSRNYGLLKKSDFDMENTKDLPKEDCKVQIIVWRDASKFKSRQSRSGHRSDLIKLSISSPQVPTKNR